MTISRLFPCGLIGLALVSLAACRQPGKGESYQQSPPQMTAGVSAEDVSSVGGEGVATGNAQVTDSERQVIYTALMRVEVEDFVAAAEKARSIAESAGGFVANSHRTAEDGERNAGNLDLRIPKARFADVLTDLKTLGKIKEESLHGQDVTEEYTDMEARLSNAKRLEMRLLELLEQQSKNLKDILEVEKELAHVRQEIEVMEGRKRFLDDRLSLATITLQLYEPHAYTTSVFDPLTNAFAHAGHLLMQSLAGLVTVVAVTLPWFLVLGVVGYFGLRIVRRWWRKQRGFVGAQKG